MTSLGHTPLDKLKIQMFRSLQNFRDRLSDRAMRAFGVPLRTSEQEIQLHVPHTPDIHIGQVFDRSWELLSPILPYVASRTVVRNHFSRANCHICSRFVRSGQMLSTGLKSVASKGGY
jgi:hypothetical protein